VTKYGQRCGCMTGRRGFLFGGLAAAGSLVAPSALFAAPRAGLIDVHHHVMPPGSAEIVRQNFANVNWSPEAAVAEMDRSGIAMALAFPGPVPFGNADQRAQTARSWNDFTAGLGQKHRGRFGLFATLPFPFVEPTLAEIDRALDSLHADGFGIATSYENSWLGDTRLWPIYEKLNDRDAVVFVHPYDAACCAAGPMAYQDPSMSGPWIEWPMNTARTIVSLMVSGTLRKYPRIRFIFAHGGGVMPLLVERLAGLGAWPAVGEAAVKRVFPNGVKAEFASLYFECAQASAQTNVTALRSLVPDSQLLFGSDYPYFPMPYAASRFAKLDLADSTRAAITRENAVRIMPGLA
jgi:6-methylsalicylate decarboxylase